MQWALHISRWCTVFVGRVVRALVGVAGSCVVTVKPFVLMLIASTLAPVVGVAIFILMHII